MVASNSSLRMWPGRGPRCARGIMLNSSLSMMAAILITPAHTKCDRASSLPFPCASVVASHISCGARSCAHLPQGSSAGGSSAGCRPPQRLMGTPVGREHAQHPEFAGGGVAEERRKVCTWDMRRGTYRTAVTASWHKPPGPFYEA